MNYLNFEVQNNLEFCLILQLCLGEANVLEQFDINEGRKKIPVAGCRCVKGVLKKSGYFRLMRNEECLFDGKFRFQH